MINSPTPSDLSKRQFLKSTVAVCAASVLAACHTETSSDKPSSSVSHAPMPQHHSTTRYDCYGIHQAGITTPHQPFGIICAFDLTAQNLPQLIDYFRTLTARIEFLTQGGELNDGDSKLPPMGSGLLGKTLSPDGLSITVSVGSSLFDSRFGLANKKPKHLQEMTRFPNDGLQKEWCDGDVSIQICAFSPETCQNALRDIIKNTARFALARWSLDGWLPKREPDALASRNLFGFRDGTGNPDVANPDVANQVLWTGVAENSLDEPTWTKNGTYQAVCIICQLVEFWDRTPLQEQNAIFGREKYSGAPLGKQHEREHPNYATDSEGKNVPTDSHIRLSNPRTPEFLKRHQLFRRPCLFIRH